MIEVNGIKTAQHIIGDGTATGAPVLMLHGWGAHRALVTPLAERLAPLGYKLYVPDLPGFGQSALPPAAWSVHEYAAWVLAYLDHHQLEKVHFFGHSFGGRLGLVLGAEHPQRLNKMVLADSAGVRPKTSAQSQLRLNSYRLIQNGLRTIRLNSLADHLRDWYINRYGSADYKSAGALRETFVRVINEDLLPYAARVKVSTLLLWGDQDMDTPLWQGQILEKTILDAGLVVFKGAGHYSYLDRLNETVRVIDYFFKN